MAIPAISQINIFDHLGTDDTFDEPEDLHDAQHPAEPNPDIIPSPVRCFLYVDSERGDDEAHLFPADKPEVIHMPA